MQEKLCTGPKEPDQALEFAITFEEGVKRRKTYGLQAPDAVKSSVKSEPVDAVEKTKSRECFRCRESNFTMEHGNFCMPTNHRRKYCKITGHLEKDCKRMFPQRNQGMMQRLKRENGQGMRRVNNIEKSEEGEIEDDEE